MATKVRAENESIVAKTIKRTVALVTNGVVAVKATVVKMIIAEIIEGTLTHLLAAKAVAVVEEEAVKILSFVVIQTIEEVSVAVVA